MRLEQDKHKWKKEQTVWIKGRRELVKKQFGKRIGRNPIML